MKNKNQKLLTIGSFIAAVGLSAMIVLPALAVPEKMPGEGDVAPLFQGLTVGKNSKLTVDENGNLAVLGTSTLTGNVTASGTLGVTGLSTLGILKVNGASNLADLNAKSATISGDLSAESGTTTLKDLGAATLTVDGKSTLGTISIDEDGFISNSGNSVKIDEDQGLVIGDYGFYFEGSAGGKMYKLSQKVNGVCAQGTAPATLNGLAVCKKEIVNGGGQQQQQQVPGAEITAPWTLFNSNPQPLPVLNIDINGKISTPAGITFIDNSLDVKSNTVIHNSLTATDLNADKLNIKGQSNLGGLVVTADGTIINQDNSKPVNIYGINTSANNGLAWGITASGGAAGGGGKFVGVDGYGVWANSNNTAGYFAGNKLGVLGLSSGLQGIAGEFLSVNNIVDPNGGFVTKVDLGTSDYAVDATGDVNVTGNLKASGTTSLKDLDVSGNITNSTPNQPVTFVDDEGIKSDASTGVAGNFTGLLAGVIGTSSAGTGGSFTGFTKGVSAMTNNPGNGIAGYFIGDTKGVMATAQDQNGMAGYFFNSNTPTTFAGLGTSQYAITTNGPSSLGGHLKVTQGGIGGYKNYTAEVQVNAVQNGQIAISCPGNDEVAISCSYAPNPQEPNAIVLNIFESYLDPVAKNCTVKAKNPNPAKIKLQATVTCFNPAL